MPALEPAKKLKTTRKKKVAEQSVEFTYFAPAANKVSLAGAFNAWDTNAHAMKKGKDGTWKLAIKLAPGRHEFKYFVDGSWAQDSPCAETTPNPFGGYNCVIGVE